MKIRITKNPVGLLDAEKEEMEKLQNNFIKTEDYYEILNQNCLFVSGRKGDGKTAIAIMLSKEKTKNGIPIFKYSILLRKYEFYRSLIFDLREAKYSFINVNQERYTSPIKEKVDIENYFQKLWEYIIYISAMKAVVEMNSDEELEVLRNYLEMKGFLIEVDNFVDLFSSIYKDDMSKNVIHQATSLNQLAINRLSDGNFITALKTLRAHLSETNRILIVIDTLEKYYAKEEEFRNAVHGMMEAIYEIKLKPENKWIDIKCFIPDELFEDFASWNLNKVSDVCVFITWRYHELLLFICKRFMSYIEENYDPRTVEIFKNKWEKVDKNDRNSLRSFWHEFFPGNITDRFGAFEDCFNYILRHTQNKPRQIIYLVNKIINLAEKRRNVLNVKPSDVYDGLHEDLDQLITDNFKPFLDQYSVVS